MVDWEGDSGIGTLVAFIFVEMTEHVLGSKKWRMTDLSYSPPEVPDWIK